MNTDLKVVQQNRIEASWIGYDLGASCRRPNGKPFTPNSPVHTYNAGMPMERVALDILHIAEGLAQLLRS